jgi:hypothetical protein
VKSKRQHARIARRPRDGTRRPIFVQICCSPAEYDALLDRAAAHQLALGAFVRGAGLIVAAEERELERVTAS